MLHEETVTPEMLALIKKFSADTALHDFVLVEGTALALQLGHRKSVDIDLFGSKDFDGESVGRQLEKDYKAEIVGMAKNNVFARIGGVRISLIAHKYPMIASLITTNGVRMAALDDIGAMKVHAIVNNGRREKDFVDMYYLLEHRSLDDLMKAYSSKYAGRNSTLARNALLYHKDIIHEGNLKMLLRRFNWGEIAMRLRSAVIAPAEVFRKTPGRENKIGEQGIALTRVRKSKGKRL